MSDTQGIKLDEATRQRLKALGELRDRSPHYLMKAAIDRYLDQEEEYEREKREDMSRWEEYKLTGNSISNEKMIAWLSELAAGKDAPWPEVE